MSNDFETQYPEEAKFFDGLRDRFEREAPGRIAEEAAKIAREQGIDIRDAVKLVVQKDPGLASDYRRGSARQSIKRRQGRDR
ncbi:MAG: hypothetical protein ABR548_07075 [Actinomycetota bacterium]